jgi:hypothetical protein
MDSRILLMIRSKHVVCRYFDRVRRAGDTVPEGFFDTRLGGKLETASVGLTQEIVSAGLS